MNYLTGNDPSILSGKGHEYVVRERAPYNLDRTIALLALIFFLPLLSTIILLMLVFDPGPIFYRHRRIGYGGEAFDCLKFRTMVVDAEQRLECLLEQDIHAQLEWHRDQKLRQDPRITILGHLLRKSSMDEIPQLINVYRGEMRIVGPRPIVHDEVHRYGRFFSHYISVTPGITGLWQVSGRNNVSYRRRVAADVYYVRNRSASFDMKIILATFGAVFTGSGTF
jgi:exopolysaccharide production protein ExoY